MKELRFIQPAPSQDFEGAAKGRRRVAYELAPALTEDKDWLESLRRDVYQELFKATFGAGTKFDTFDNSPSVGSVGVSRLSR